MSNDRGRRWLSIERDQVILHLNFSGDRLCKCAALLCFLYTTGKKINGKSLVVFPPLWKVWLVCLPPEMFQSAAFWVVTLMLPHWDGVKFCSLARHLSNAFSELVIFFSALYPVAFNLISLWNIRLSNQFGFGPSL